MSTLVGVPAKLTDTQFEVFTKLTTPTFLVVDTEYSLSPEGQHLISIAVVPVIAGRRQARNDFYREMNPGVPIDPRTIKIHGFTDAAVAGKRQFSFYAPTLLAALDRPDAVWVSHTNADLRLVRTELDRVGRLADLPDLPVLDTSTLPRLLRLDGIGNHGAVKLATLCTLLGVTNPSAHHARSDARATADALVALLRVAAASGRYMSLNELLADHDRGTTGTPKTPTYIRNRLRVLAPSIPDMHYALHGLTLTVGPTAAELTRWLDLARKCVEMRCPWLRDEARDAALNGAAEPVLRELTTLLPSATEPGQTGTLLGAIALLLTEDLDTLGLTSATAMTWWAAVKAQVQASAACARKEACPACVEGAPCPRDTIHQPVARIATLGSAGAITGTTIKNHLFGKRPDRRINDWPRNHPEIAGYMAWLVVQWEQTHNRRTFAAKHYAQAVEKGLDRVEPRLATIGYQALLDLGDETAATQLIDDVLSHRTTDPGYTDLALLVEWHQHGLAVARRHQERTVVKRRAARPRERSNPNPYQVS